MQLCADEETWLTKDRTTTEWGIKGEIEKRTTQGMEKYESRPKIQTEKALRQRRGDEAAYPSRVLRMRQGRENVEVG